jgi:hypothetical protein
MSNLDIFSTFIENIKNIRTKEFEIENIEITNKIIEKKPLNENLKEFRDYQSLIKKKALLEKQKPGNYSKKEYEVSSNNIDILEDDIFKNNDNDSNEVVEKKDFFTMDREIKINLIKEYINRKNIILEESDLEKIYNIIDDPNIILKKYFSFSQIYHQLTKISFIKKLENGSYIINLDENKSKKVKKYFI